MAWLQSTVFPSEVDNQLLPQLKHTLKISSTAWYQIVVMYESVANTATLVLMKSVNGGAEWYKIHTLETSRVDMADTWYDKWTDGGTGTLWHIVWFESSPNDNVNYIAFDTADDTLSSMVVVQNGTSVAISGGCISITKARGGQLGVAWDLDGGTELGFATSTTEGSAASFSARLTVWEATRDYVILMPNPDSADAQDIIGLYWDFSANEISRKNFTDAANTWTETSIATSMNEGTTVDSPQYAATYDHTNNNILMIAWDAKDTSTADLLFWTIDNASISSPVNVNTNADNCVMAALQIIGTDIYAFYAGKSDGSQVFSTLFQTGTLGIYYKVSSDSGATWGSEQTLLTPNQTNGSVAGLTCDLINDAPVVTFRTGTYTGAGSLGLQRVAYPEPAVGSGMLVHPGMTGRLSG